MTSSFLQSELTSLIADSKRKFGDVRSAAEKSLGELKAIIVTSETQLAADLARRSGFIDPFLLACATKNAKLANSATTCLQRLIASKAITADRLGEVLDAFKDVVNTSYDVQLKILQTLPALLQLYSSQLHGQLLATTLEICATLQASKTHLVASSAGATLWQLIASVFESATPDALNDSNRDDISTQDETDDKSTSADDAGRLFEDLCSTLNQTEPTFIRTDNLSAAYLVQTLQKIINEHATYITSRPYLVEACRRQLIPAITSLLEVVEDGSLLVLLLQIAYLALQKLAPLVFADMKPTFLIILRFTDRNVYLWKRSLALEFFARLFTNFGLIARLFDEFADDEDNVITNSLATFVRIASEDPVLIGLGRQSTMPAHHRDDLREDDLAAIEAQSVGGLASVTSADIEATGISLENSTVEHPLFDASDPSKVGTVPKTYPYTLLLDSISSFCEGLSKFIMPLSAMTRLQDEQGTDSDAEGTRRSQSMTRSLSQHPLVPRPKYQRLVNPLKVDDLPQLPQVQACAKLVEDCWPAILAMCSTFLNAALDSHFYHVLIRSIQKLAQVSGTLDLSTPRDALLTSLAKGSMPANAANFIQLGSPVARRDPNSEQQEPRTPVKSPPPESSKQSIDAPRQALNVRHLLCLRALLNLGIALGPTLGHESWFIVIETLQQAEALMTIASAGRSSLTQDGQSTITGEMAAVNTAARRMLESTKSYTDASFGIVISVIFRLMGENPHHNGTAKIENQISPAPIASPGALTSPTLPKHGHRPARSVSGLWIKTKALDIEVAFAFTKLTDLARINLYRFALIDSQEFTWQMMVARLLQASQSEGLKDALRLQAASTVDLIAMEAMKLIHGAQTEDAHADADADADELQCLCLKALADQMDNMPQSTSSELSVEITKRVFEALEDILGHSGETLRRGWVIVFQILRCSFPATDEIADESTYGTLLPSTLVAFRCVQLVCTDFVELLQFGSFRLLLSLLYTFGAQQVDTNMALTTTGLLRNIAALLQQRLQEIEISEDDFNYDDEQSRPQTPLRLWCAALNELAKMCSDTRKDVRDASIRILLQAIDSASTQLNPASWSVLLDAVPLSILQYYQSALSQQEVDTDALSSSSAQLTEGLTNLLVQNMSTIAQSADFSDTWKGLMDIYNVILESGELSTFSLVHKCISRLLKAIEGIDMDHTPFIESALMLWAWHPVPQTQSDQTETSNQAALTAHLHVFTQAYATNAKAVQHFTHHRRGISEYATSAIRKTLLSAIHPPYTNDVKSMSSEQQEAIRCLEIVKVLFVDELENFSGFVLELLQDMLDIEKGSLKPRPDKTFISNKTQKPTYIAVSSRCIDLLRGMIDETKDREDYISIIQLPYALDMLSAIIKTKYHPLPGDSVAPIWLNATTTAVLLLEATTSLPSSNEELTDVAQTVIATVAANLGCGGLPLSPTASPVWSEDTLLADEAFDSAHFRRFHVAAIPIISHPVLSSRIRRQYILALFHGSLLYQPWHGDLPSTTATISTTTTTGRASSSGSSSKDSAVHSTPESSTLLSDPLNNLTTVRPASIHVPTFARRQAIAYTALDALFALLDPSSKSYNQLLALDATPYLLLRTALPLKTFLADQRLRGWTPLSEVMRAELLGVLERAVALRVVDRVVQDGCRNSKLGVEALDRIGGTDVGVGTGKEGDRGEARATESGDGKAHLRALYSLIVRVQKEWRTTTRLPGGLGWMDVKGGQGRKVEGLLERWIEIVGEGWDCASI